MTKEKSVEELLFIKCNNKRIPINNMYNGLDFMVNAVLQHVEGCSRMTSFIRVFDLTETIISTCSKKFSQKLFIT